METRKVRKIGDCLMIAIPVRYAEKLKLKEEDYVIIDLMETGGQGAPEKVLTITKES